MGETGPITLQETKFCKMLYALETIEGPLLGGLVGLGDQMVCLLCMPWTEVIDENANQNIPSGHYWSETDVDSGMVKTFI